MTRRRRLAAVLRRLVPSLVLSLTLGLAPAAHAETLVAATSTTSVQINSNFTGTEITVFGAIERDIATVSRAAAYEVVVTLTGPRETVMTRRKERFLGLWMNRRNLTYVDVPSFYAVLSSGPIEPLATPTTLKRYQIGLANLTLQGTPAAGNDAAAVEADFREAFLRLKQKAGLYAEYPSAVTLLGSNLFRATIPLPANVPVGKYRAEIVLFRESVPLAQHVSEITVSKTGFEQFVTDLAAHNSLIYGVGAVALALFIGWFGGLIFRRD